MKRKLSIILIFSLFISFCSLSHLTTQRTLEAFADSPSIVYCAIDSKTIGDYDLYCNVNKGDKSWDNIKMTKSSYSYLGKPIYSVSIDDSKYSGLDCIEFNFNSFSSKNIAFSTYTSQSVYSGKMWVFNESSSFQTYDTDRIFADGDTVCLIPNANWKTKNAWFGAYFFNPLSSKWVKLENKITEDGKSYYFADCPSDKDYSAVIFVRLKPSSDQSYNSSNNGLNWDNKWNQTGNLYNVENYKAFKINDSSWEDGTWVNGGYKISYLKGMDASGSMDASYVLVTNNFTIPNSSFTAPAGKTFESWLGSDSNIYFPNDEYSSKQNLVLTAKWVDVTTFKVTASVGQSGYGTLDKTEITGISPDTSISSNNNIVTIGDDTITATPSISTDQYSYTFSSWSGIPTSGKVTENITLTANFTRTTRTYTISFDKNNAAASGNIDSITQEYGTDYTVPSSKGFTSPSGYNFSSWNTLSNGSGTKYKIGDTINITGNVTLYAQWEPRSSNQPIYVKMEDNNVSTPYIYVYNNSEDYEVAYPGIELTKVANTDSLYSYTLPSGKYYEYMVINNGDANGATTKKTCDISLVRISYYGYNMMYVARNLSNAGSTAGCWTARNYYMNGNSTAPTGSTFRVWVDRNASGYGSGKTWIYHYWKDSTDVEVICSGYANMSTNSSAERYLVYFDIPLEAVGKNGQWKVYNDVTGALIKAGSNIVYGDKTTYSEGDNSQIFYMNNADLTNISLGSLSSSITSNYINVANYNLVLEAYCTCSDSLDNGYGKFTGTNSVTTTWKFEDSTVAGKLGDYSFTDYLYTGSTPTYTNPRGTGYSVTLANKIAYMTSMASASKDTASKGMGRWSYFDSSDVDNEQNNVILIIVVSSSALLLIAGASFFMYKKKKHN